MDDSGGSTVSVRTITPRNAILVPFNLIRRDIWLHSVIALFVLAYCVSTAAISRTSDFNTFWDGGVYIIAEVLPVIAMVLCAMRWPAQRAPWLLIGVGVLVHAAGDLVYSFHDQNLVPVPVPAPSDVVYLASYVLLVLGVLLLTQNHGARVRPAVRVEGIVAGLAVAALAALLWYGPVFSVTGSLWHAVLADGYPMGNLVLLVLLISSLAPYGYQPNVPVTLFLAGVAWFVFGDIVYFGQGSSGAYVSRTFLNATWLVGLWLTGLAATAVDRRRSGALRRSGPAIRGATWVPLAAAFIFVAVAANYLIVPGVDTEAMVLACLGLVLFGINVTLAKHDFARMALEREGVDVVTGLITRSPFLEQVQSWLDEGRDGVVGVIVLDIIDFTMVNEAIGYAIGDELLWVVGRRAEYRLGDRGVFAHLDGDHFGFASAVSSDEEVTELAEEVQNLVRDRFHLSGVSVGVVGRIGVATVAPGASSAADLLARAEAALGRPATRVDFA
jgi:diguanylate cyclase (GGDEF)-like protein